MFLKKYEYTNIEINNWYRSEVRDVCEFVGVVGNERAVEKF